MMEKHFTATVFVLKEDKILLIHHKKLQTWLPPGGHIDPNETPFEAALREAKEETGLDVEIFRQENIWIDSDEAKSFPRPYICLVEDIPEHKNKPAHQHIDFVYVGYLVAQQEEKIHQGEVNECRWFTKEEVEKLEEKQDIFPNVKRIFLHIFSEYIEKKRINGT